MTTTGSVRLTVGAIISGVMVALGAFVLIRLMVRPAAPLTGTPVMDLAFGLFFVARGGVYFWMARRRARM